MSTSVSVCIALYDTVPVTALRLNRVTRLQLKRWSGSHRPGEFQTAVANEWSATTHEPIGDGRTALQRVCGGVDKNACIGCKVEVPQPNSHVTASRQHELVLVSQSNVDAVHAMLRRLRNTEHTQVTRDSMHVSVSEGSQRLNVT